MEKNFEELYKNARDILSTAGIIYDICRDADEETTTKIRPLAELICKKADKVCLEVMGLKD